MAQYQAYRRHWYFRTLQQMISIVHQSVPHGGCRREHSGIRPKILMILATSMGNQPIYLLSVASSG
jgi:hypothetical protein